MGRQPTLLSRWRFVYKRQQASASTQRLYRSQVRVLIVSTDSSSSSSSSAKMNGELHTNGEVNGEVPATDPAENIVEKNEVEATKESEEKKSNGASSSSEKDEQEVVFIQDMGFTVKIVSPGTEAFDIQVSNLFLPPIVNIN